MDFQNTKSSIACNLCGSPDSEEICRADRDGNYLRTVVCKHCGLVYSDPRPNEEEVKNFYKKDYRVQYKGTYTPQLKHVYRAGKIAEQRYLFLKDVVKTDSAILDVGASSGEFVYLMRGLGFEARGIEPNEGYGLYAKNELGLPIEIGVMQQFDLPENSIDIVTMHHVFEHLDDPFLILERLHKVLRDEGFLVIEVPNVEATCFAPIHRFHTAHLFNFNRETLEAIGRKAGFAVYKTVISKDGGVITTMFQKAKETEKISGELSGNYEKIVKIIKNHTPLSHYLTPNPYVRPIKKLQMYAGETSAIKNSLDGKAVLDEIIARCKNQ